VFLEVRASNAAAIRLYEGNGFDTVGRRVNYYPAADGREDALVMRWES
jgi:ribosomal-protein-alanine N-acetyltransferase